MWFGRDVFYLFSYIYLGNLFWYHFNISNIHSDIIRTYYFFVFNEIDDHANRGGISTLVMMVTLYTSMEMLHTATIIK